MTGKMFNKMCAIGVTSLFLAISTSPYAYASITYETVALTGESSPGVPGGRFLRFGNPKINNGGQTAFRGFLEGPGLDLTNNNGIWSEDNGFLKLVVREGNAAPNTPDGVVFGNVGFGDPIFNDAGRVAFQGFLVGTDIGIGNDSGLWSDSSGSVKLVVREGDPAPGIGSLFTSVTRPAFNNAGHTAFVGNGGIWLDTLGHLNRVVLSDGEVPGTESGVMFNGFGITSSPPLLNDRDQVAFFAGLSGTGVDTTNDNGIWSTGSGSLTLIAREGEAPPGIEAGNVFVDSFGLPAFNNAGQTAFLGHFRDPNINGLRGSGIWSEGTGALSLVARTGADAPGTETGVVFNNLHDPVFSDNSQTAFRGTLSGPGVDNTNLSAIWSEGSGSLQLVARQGSQATGAGPEAIFLSFNEDPIINGRGQTAFRARMRMGDSGELIGGIWATDLSGNLQLVVREGDYFDVDDHPLRYDLRVISSIDLPNTDFLSSAFNDLGQLTFTLRFTDGSDGVFIATVPEPTSILLIATGLGLICRRNH